MLNNFLKRLITAICLLVFLHIEATWLLKFSRSSMCTPSNLQVVEGSINVPSTEKLSEVHYGDQVMLDVALIVD